MTVNKPSRFTTAEINEFRHSELQARNYMVFHSRPKPLTPAGNAPNTTVSAADAKRMEAKSGS